MRYGLVKPFMHFIPKSMHQCADRQILALKYSHSCSHKHVYVNGNLKNINLTVNILPSVRCICNSLELLLGMMQVQLRFWMQESHEKKRISEQWKSANLWTQKKSKLITFKIEKKRIVWIRVALVNELIKCSTLSCGKESNDFPAKHMECFR